MCKYLKNFQITLIMGNSMRFITSFILMFLVTSYSAQVTFEWVKGFHGTTNNFGLSVQTDSNGNVYNMGTYGGIVDFDPGIGVFNLNSNGNINTFLQKMTSNGVFLWALTIPMVGSQMTLDSNGNIFTVGRFSGNVDLDPGNGVFNVVANNVQHSVVIKLDANGQFQWAKTFGGTGIVNSVSDIALDNSGNIYTTGRFEGITDFDPSNSVFNSSSSGQIDVFVHKMDVNGNFLWVKTFGSSGLDYGLSVTVDNIGDVYTAGTFTNSVDFDPSAGIANLTSLSGNNVFVQKLNQNGSFIWVKSFAANLVNSIEFDGLGNIYTIGNFQNTVDFDPGLAVTNLSSAGGTNAFIQKLDISGNFLWAKSFGGTNTTTPKCIHIDLIGNFYVAGSFGGSVDFDPSLNSLFLNSSGSNDIFVSKFDEYGNFINALGLGGNSIDYANCVSVTSIGEIYLTGVYSNAVDFDPSISNATLTTGGNHDVFVLKFNQCIPTTSTDIQYSCSPFTWINGQTYTSNNNSATFIISNSQGCDSTITLNLTILPMPSSAVTLSSGVLSANQQNATYQWLDCDNNYITISGASQNTFSPIVSGNYAVQISFNNCVDTSACTFVQVGSSGIQDNFLQTDKMYPNPNNGSFIFESLLGGFYVVTDLEGRLVYKFQIAPSEKTFHGLNFLSKGVYFITKENECNNSLKLIIH